MRPPRRRTGRVRAARVANDEELRQSIENLLAAESDPRIGTGAGLRERFDRLLEPDAQEEDSWIGEQLGRYRITGKLGQGGMGLVYLAEQDSPRRLVALKMLRAGLDSPEYRARMHREAQALGLLQHPGIAQSYDAGVHETAHGMQPYLVME